MIMLQRVVDQVCRLSTEHTCLHKICIWFPVSKRGDREGEREAGERERETLSKTIDYDYIIPN